MAIRYVDTVKNTRLTAVATAIDAGSGAGKIRIYDFGKINLLVDVPFLDPCFTSITAGVLTFSMPVVEPIALVSGTAAEATIVTSANALVADNLTVGTSSAYDVQLNSTTITAGQPCKVLAASLTHG